MSNTTPLLALCVFLLTAMPLAAQDAADAVGLEMERQLGQRSLDKIANGSASDGQSRLTPPPATPSSPAAPSAPFGISWPVGLAGAVAFALAGFAAGMIARRKTTVSEEDSAAPAALWLDAGNLQSELKELETQQSELQQHNEQLAADREQLLLLHADQLHELRGEKDELERELNALRLRGDGADGSEQQLIDQLRTELEQLRGADDETSDRREVPGEQTDVETLRSELAQQSAHVGELEELLRVAHDENHAIEHRFMGKEAQVEALETALSARDEELEALQAELAGLRDKATQFERKELHVESLDDELTTLRDEMNELLGKTGQYQALIPELENKLFHRDEQIGALESDLDATSFEVAERDRIVKQWEAQVRHLQESLAGAQQTIARLEGELSAAADQNKLLQRNPATGDLQQEVLELRSRLSESQRELEDSRASLENAEPQRKRVDEWSSTVESLQADIRRKSTLIDSQADFLASREKQIEQMQAEMDELRTELASRNEQSQSLRGLLEQAGDVVVSLRDEIDHDEHVATRLRLAQNPKQDPFSHHEDAIDPVEADIEALRFTSRSRRDLADSLETILQEEREALEQASRRVSSRDEEVIALKNELAANRLSMVVLQSRLSESGGSGVLLQVPMEPARIERELQQSMRVLDALRADLHKWRGRVKPLHEALVSRNERIHALEAEVAALRSAQGLDPAEADDELVDGVTDLLNRAREGEAPEQERSRTLDEMKRQWDRIVSLETELAETGARLARTLELDDVRCRQIESLELARSAQMARFAELRAELEEHGIDPEMPAAERGGNIVDLDARRPS